VVVTVVMMMMPFICSGAESVSHRRSVSYLTSSWCSKSDDTWIWYTQMDLKKKGKKAVVAWAWRLSQKLSCATFPQAGCSAMAAPWRS
jgi:hypothetical protein